MIRSYGSAMQGFMGTYLEKNVEAFQQLQKVLQEQSQKVYGDNSARLAGPLGAVHEPAGPRRCRA
jgi:polyhydroxyalkanoate synthesis regulator protein